MTTGLSAPSGGERLGFRVEGMDCASCVGKIETALNRLGGITDVTVNFATETLQLSRDTRPACSVARGGRVSTTSPPARGTRSVIRRARALRRTLTGILSI